MQVKATMVRTRLEFLSERYGADGLHSVLEALSAEDRRTAQSVLPSSWVAFALLNRLDDVVVRKLGGGQHRIIEEAGAFSAHKNLTSIYKVFVEQARGDPQHLMQSLSGMHATFYDWGSMRAHAVSAGRCRMETDYLSGASRTNCRSAIGFYSEALKQLELEAVRVEEKTCQATGAALCVYDLFWER